jgi:formate dehydrogenase major subunit
MQMQRRTFLKGTAAVGVGLAFFDLSKARAELRLLKIAKTTETRSTCPYCAVSCGVIIHTLGDKAKNVTPSVVHVEGDPDHPINRGTLCPKGATLRDDINNPLRLMVPKIAKHIKSTRDRTFVAKNAKGQVVNRTPGIAVIGGCTDTNEFNWLQDKFMAGLGVVYRDSQARV